MDQKYNSIDYGRMNNHRNSYDDNIRSYNVIPTNKPLQHYPRHSYDSNNRSYDQIKAVQPYYSK